MAAPLRAPVAYALSALSGITYFLGFPGVNLWPLVFVSQAPLLLALRGQTPRRAAGLGFTAGMFISMLGFYWLLGMLRVFAQLPTAICLLLMSLICAYQAGRTALLGWLYARAEARGWPALPVFALAFATSELVYPLLFPWYFGASVHNAPALLQVADLGGPYLVGVVLLGPNLALAEILLARREARAPSRLALPLGLALPALAAAYGLLQMHRIDAIAQASPAIRVGIAQGNQPLLNKKTPIETHLALTQTLKDKGAELVVWSEGAIPITYPEATYEAQVREGIGSKLGVPAILGAAISRPGTPYRTYFNTALLTGADGTVLGRYDKQYLLVFGEYLPLGQTFPILYRWSPHSGRFSPGTSIEPVVFQGHKVSVLICYEDILPSFVNRTVRHADPDLLVNLANDTWFGDTTEPFEHLALAQLRAVEHRRYLIRATNSGVSAIIDAAGRRVLEGGTYREEALLGEARFMRASTVYEALGDVPFYLGAAALAAMALFRRPRAGAAATKA